MAAMEPTGALPALPAFWVLFWLWIYLTGYRSARLITRAW